jgi:hypothetical protein
VSDRTPDMTVTQYTVAILTEADCVDWFAWDIYVEKRGRGRWAVSRGGGIVLSDEGRWVVEPINSERTDEWLDHHRFDRHTALRLAGEQALTLRINGYTAQDILDKRGRS